MNCKFCNAQIDDDVLICPVCNQALTEDGGEETTAMEEPAVAEAAAEAETIVEVETTETENSEVETAETENSEVETTETENSEVETTETEAVAECEQPAAKKRRAVKITAVVCSIVLLLGVLGVCAWGIYHWLDEGTFGEDDVMVKEIYTAEAEEAMKTADKVVAKVGDKTLTNRQLQVFYWMEVMNFIQQNQYYLSYYGLDPTKPLSDQRMSEDSMTWEQFFLETALSNWHYYQCLEIEAEKRGFTLSEELQKNIDNLDDSMEINLAISGYSTVDEMLQQDMGAIATMDGYANYVRMYYVGAEYGASLYLKFDPTREEVEAYWNANGEKVEETYKVNKESGPLVDIRHILIAVEGGTQDEENKTVYSEEDWANCLKKAEDILAEWKAGEATEDAFALLANTYSTDPGSNTLGGLYSYVYDGQMVPEFNAWCFDASRKPGDTGIVRSDYGYHIIYFVMSEEGWLRRSEQALIEESCTEILAEYMKENPLKVCYANILLSKFDLF